ncbi:MAG: ribose 5-phosphate isomerase B [Balneolaceae bacterium]
MIIPIASDHAGFKAKTITKRILEKLGHTPVDFGTHTDDSVDYPDFAIHVSERVNSGEYEQGIILCGSGQGVCMTANKFPKIRAALVYNQKVAEMTRLHNNANVLCLPGRELEENVNELEAILTAWFGTEFEGGRHLRRIEKIEALTQKDLS